MLTRKQEKFVQNIMKGMSQAEAYRQSYSAKGMSDNAIYREASLLLKNPKVAQRYEELNEKAAIGAIMTAQERMIYLSQIIKGEAKAKKIVSYRDGAEEIECEADISDKLKAIDLMNKMQGEYVQKVQASMSYEDNLKKVADEDEY
jgi:phage terminase small subunit